MQNPFLFETQELGYGTQFEDSFEFFEDEFDDENEFESEDEYDDEFEGEDEYEDEVRRRRGGRFSRRPSRFRRRNLPLKRSRSRPRKLRSKRPISRSRNLRSKRPSPRLRNLRSKRPRPRPRPRPGKSPTKRPRRRRRRRYPIPYPVPYLMPPIQDCSEHIRLIQRLLNRVLGLNLPVDGFMNVETRSAIRSFQNQQNPPAEGDTGSPSEPAPNNGGADQPEPPDQPNGDKAQEEFDDFEFYDDEADDFEFFDDEFDEFELEEEVSRNSAEYIKWVQRSLNKILGLSLAVDGINGPMTRSAIRSFQQKQGLTADGIVGPITEGALIRAGAGSPPQSSGTTPKSYFPLPSIPKGGSIPSGSPVNGGRVTSPFGYRTHPLTGERKLHQGVDIGGLSVETPINATAAGRVIFAAESGCSGNMVKIDHGNGYVTYYLHLNSFSVRNGQTVSRGQKVGGLGGTGCVTGPHLHYEVRRDGTAIDPAPFINS